MRSARDGTDSSLVASVRHRWLALLTTAALGVAGCNADPDAEASHPGRWSGSIVSKAATIEYAGCAEVLDDGTCVLPTDRRIRLWLPESSWLPATTPPIDRSNRELSNDAPGTVPRVVRSRDIDGGRLLWIELPDAATRLDVHPGSADGSPIWTLALAEPRHAESLAIDSLSPEAMAGYQALARGRFAEAADILSGVRRAHAAAGRRLSEVSTAGNILFCHLQERRLDRARETLDGFDAGHRAPAEARFLKSYFRGAIARLSGDTRTALEALDAASSRARRLGMGRELGMSGEMQAAHLRRLGRAREAAELFESLRHDGSYALEVDDNRWVHNYGWSLLMAREAGDLSASDTPNHAIDLVAMLESVKEAFAGERYRTDQRFSIRLNLALAHVQDGRTRQARGVLEEAAEWFDEPPVHLQFWWLDIEARIALAEGRMAEAIELYDRLERLARSAYDADSRRRALAGRARVLIATDRTDSARAALVEAERLLDQQSLWIPFDQGRETFAADAGATTRLLLDLLLREGHEAEAFETARRSRSRVLRGLQVRDRLADLDPTERRAWEQAVSDHYRRRAELDELVAGDWQRTADQLDDARRERAALDREIARALERAFAIVGTLPPGTGLPAPRPGEVTLLFHPLPRGWIGFAALDDTLVSRRFELPALDPTDAAFADTAAAVLLEPFARWIRSAERVRILSFGSLRQIDFHTLPLDGDILVAGRPVAYGLDLAVPTMRRVDASERRALIVADPLGDLPAAGKEAERVRRALLGSRSSWRVESLHGTDATARAVAERLPSVDWLHYAGHGVFSGRAGWRSALPMSSGSRLTLGDLLALDRGPAQIVLSACDTARTPSTHVEGLGIAHGFLLAGARQVVAADRPVDDAAASELVDALYRERRRVPEHAVDLAEILRRAQLARRDADGTAWAAFRVLEP